MSQGEASDSELSDDEAPHSDTLLAEGSHAPTLDGFSPRSATVKSGPRPSRAIDQLPTVSRDHYEVGEPFAKGGIGKISAALDWRLDRRVAIKELRRNNRYALERFAREIRITAKLQHPNIVQVFEAGRWEGGDPFFAMKLVDGDSLEGAISSCVTLEDRLRMIRHVSDVADAMAHAHTRRIVHRDLKPGNVLVGPFGETVVIDWGLAKDLGDDDEPEILPPSSGDTVPDRYQTTEGVVLGTPSYMPPEQAAGRAVDERADVYALGAIMYQALSGKTPYHEYHPKRVLERVIAGPPTPLERLAPDLPRDLLAIVDKAMARQVDDRYRTAARMAEELARFMNGRLVSAYDYSFADLVRRFVKRHRAAMGTALVGALVLMGVGVVSFRRIARERDAATVAQQAEARARTLEEAAHAAAERRLDEAVLSAARGDLDEDPTRAVARLKRLGEMIAGAASVAADAVERGVARRVLTGHTDRIDAVAYAPSGRFVASAGVDGVIRLFVRDIHSTLRLEKHRARVPVLAFTDDDVLVSADYDGLIVVWDATTGTAKSSIVGHKNQEIRALAVHERLVATVAEDGVRVWNVETGKAALAFEKNVERTGFAVFVPGRQRLVTGSHHGEIRVWDLAGEDHWVLTGHEGPVHAAAVSPNGKLLVSAGEDGTVRKWDLDTREGEVLGRHERGAHVVRFLDAGQVVSGGMDGRVVAWRLADGTSRVIAVHEERVTAIATHGGRWIASAGWDKRTVLTDEVNVAHRTLRGHTSVISALAFSPDGQELASASWDRTVRLWPTANAHRQIRAHEVGVKTVALDATGTRAVSGGHDDRVKVWDVASGGLVRAFEGHTDHVFRVLFSPDGEHVASSSDDRTVRSWRVGDGTSRVYRGHTADVEEIAFSPDGKWIASAGEDANVGLWPVSGEGEHMLGGHTGAVTAVAFTPTSDTLLSASADGTIVSWDVAGAKRRGTETPHVGGVTSLAISDAGTVASTGRDDRLMLWDMSSAPQLVAPVAGADRVSISKGGGMIAASSRSGEITLCSVGPPPRCRSLVGHEERVHAMRFTPDEQLLVSGSEDGTVRIWSTATGESRPIRVHHAAVFDIALGGDLIVSASGDRTIGLLRLIAPQTPAELRAELSQLTELTLPSSLDAGVAAAPAPQ